MTNKSSANNKITKTEKFLWILLGAVLDFITYLIYSYNTINVQDYLTYWPSNILLIALFSYLLLKMKLYKHHYLIIFIITIIGIACNFISGNFTLVQLKKNYKGYLTYFFAESTMNILYVLYKFFMIKKFIKSYEILFFQGLIEVVIGIITLIITTKIYETFDSFNEYINDLDGAEIGIFIGLMFTNFITYLIYYIIIDIFTPFHIFLLNILSQILIFSCTGGLESETYIIVLFWILLAICIFMVLVFIEIIQLNFCGLSTMTKMNIEERASKDVGLCTNNDDNATLEQKLTYKGYHLELQDMKDTISSKKNKTLSSVLSNSIYDENNVV